MNKLTKRLLTGLMSAAMMFNMAATPIYATGEEEIVSSVQTFSGSQSLADRVEQYYGENGSITAASVSAKWQEASATIMAGQAFNLTLDWTLTAAGTYNYDSQEQSMFEVYKKTAISFTLPEGVVVLENVQDALQSVQEVTHEGNRWTLWLNDNINATSSNNGTIKVPLQLEGNGVVEINKVLDFSQDALGLKINTKFDIMDYTDPVNPIVYKEMEKEYQGTGNLEKKTTTTQDEWGIEKKVAGEPQVSDDKSTVTVKFALTVGLLNEGTIVTNESSYARPGRVPFASVQLTETPAVENREGNNITAQRITVTPNFAPESAFPVTAGKTVVLPVDTCGNHSNLVDVDGNAPYLSTYTVEVVYPYEEFIASYHDQNQGQLEIRNQAELTYTLAGGSKMVANSNANQMVGEVTPPAQITIVKYIENDGKNTLYIAENFTGDPVQGPAEFTITDEAGKAVALYQKNADGTYSLVSGNTVAVDPAGGTGLVGTDGSVTVYLDAGTYTVKETKGPENTSMDFPDPQTITVAEGEAQTVEFADKEKIGKITLTKQGTNATGVVVVLEGAGFGLYKDKACTDLIEEGSTNSSGSLTFDRLPYGTYYVKEITAPDGYVLDEKVYPFTLSEQNANASQTIQNNRNVVTVELQKEMYNGKNYVNVGVEYYTEFAGCFALEQKEGEDWKDVKTDLSLTNQGKINIELPVYDETGKAITYRFRENLPEGWHAPSTYQGDTTGGVMYSEAFTLESEVGTGKPYQVTMQNDRNGSILLTKEFYDITASGYVKKTGTTQEASFKLYQENAAGKLELYSGDVYNTQSGVLEITDLPRTQSDGTAVQYYLVEESVTGYVADANQTGDNTAESAWQQKDLAAGGSVMAWGPFDFTPQGESESNLEQTITVKNYENKIGVVVTKEDSITHQYVSGAAFSIYEGTNDQGPQVEGNVAIPNGGAFLKLEPGKTYWIKESTVPQGYTDVTPGGGISVNLTGVTAGAQTEVKTYTLKNLPDPKIQVAKRIIGNGIAGGGNALTGVQFEVYRKTDDTFEPVYAYGNTTPLVVYSGSSKQLPAGEYYLKEVVPAENTNHVLDPNTYPDLYTKGEKGDDGSFYFGPYNVATVEAPNDLTQNVTIQNYSDLGAVQVTKYALDLDGTENVLGGAELSIYRVKKDGTETLVTAKTTPSGTGQVTFTDLPIYNGTEKITYLIRETKAPAGYTVSKDEIRVTLTPGETVSEDSSRKKLKIVNRPEVSFTVTKVFYNIWEHSFTQREYLMPSAKIALFQETEEGTYTFVEMLSTSETGDVTFTGLSQVDHYIAVEYSIPNTPDYDYLEPSNGGMYLSEKKGFEDETKLAGKTLKQADLEKLYYVEKAANLGNPVYSVAGKLVNVEHWAQLHIEKYVLENGQEGTVVGAKRPINNAQFDLYMQVLDPDVTTNQALTFDPDHLDKYTLVGQYSSGTLYDTNGIRQDGKFATNILKSADNVVYWLVETSAGTGAEMNLENQIILIKRNGTDYTNDSESINANDEGKKESCTGTISYEDDKVTQGKVENLPIYGGGGSMFSTVRIAKWAGELDKDGEQKSEFTPLGNAWFEMWLVKKDGTPVELLETFTTGLDNDLSTDNPYPEVEKTAWASSRSYDFKSLYDKYEKNKELYESVIWTDTDGNGYARVMLVETSTPAGYDTPTKGFPLIMFFHNVKGQVTEVFNDAYYVTEKDTKESLAGEGDTVWACYPTQLQDDNTYTLIEDLPDTVDQKQYRIVNWSVDNFAVTVDKYGYIYDANTQEKTAAELDEYYLNASGRVPLANVTMKLQRYYNDTGWRDYNYHNEADVQEKATFTTDENGHFAFPKGLLVGRYRIIETEPATGYDNVYDGSSTGSGDTYYDQKAYYFTVTTKNVHISMYNPDEQSLTVEKQDTAGRPQSGAQFTLTSLTDQDTTVTGKAGAQAGQTVFANLSSGVYKISEDAAPANFSKEYLDQYLKATYADKKATAYGTEYSLGNFADTGIYLGYITQLQGNEVVVKDKIQLSDYDISASDMVLDIQDPALCTLTLYKKDAQDATKALTDATFQVEYKPFQSWKDAETLESNTNTWQTIGSYKTQGDTGSVLVSDLEPGIYKVTETQAPDGYSLNTTPQYIVLTGGMNKTVTQGDSVSIPSAEKDGSLTFTNLKKVKLTVTKTLDTGALELGEGESHTFTFVLTEGTKTLGTKALTFTKDKAGDQTVEFEGLEQGKTYTLTETFTADHDDFVLTGMTITGGDFAQDNPDLTNKSGTFTVGTTGDDVAITVTNRYLVAEIEILKVRASDGTPLTGADFAAYRVESNGSVGKTDVSTSVVDEGDGSYVIRVPLKTNRAETFCIQETNAPAGYVNDHPCTNIIVSPGEHVKHGDFDSDTMTGGTREENDQAMLAKYIFPNYLGSVINITKYDDMKESVHRTPMENVSFTLYEKNAQGGWTNLETKSTEADGTVGFTVESGKIYAVTESVPAGYARLQGLYAGDSAMTTETEGGQIYHLLNNGEALRVGQTYTYDAFNVPVVELEVRKMNAQDATDSNPPTATVSIYEVPAGTETDLTQAEVEALMVPENRKAEDVPVTQKAKDTGTNAWYCYADKSTATVLGTAFAAGSTYLVVETQSSMTQLRDNDFVTWYAVHTIPAGTTEKQTVTLRNIEGTATQTLGKTTENPSNESLLTNAATMRYTLTPQVDNTYPLTSYVLEDRGLGKAYHGVTELSWEDYLKGKYSITRVTLGDFSHNSAAYNNGISTDDLQATVTFYGFDNKVLMTKTVKASDDNKVVGLNSPEKAARVTISWESPTLKDTTGYALGQNFTPGNVSLTIQLDKQVGGQGVQAVTKVVNQAQATMKYFPWDTQGNKATTETVDTKEATAENTFAEQKVAKVSITKTAGNQQVNLNNGEEKYTLVLKNEASAQGSMEDPFIVDLLPQGMELNDGDGNVTITSTDGSIKQENLRVETNSGETALFIFLDGSLNPGQSVTVTLELKCTPAAALYGGSVTNYAIAGSRLQGVESIDNPRKTSFMTSDGQWPQGLEETLTSLKNTQRIAALRSMLGQFADFGYVGTAESINWAADSGTSLIKLGRGDRSTEQGFTSNLLNTVSNDGYMDYQLIFSNLSTTELYTNITMLDILPFEGDVSSNNAYRGSAWNLIFESITSVEKVAKDGTKTTLNPDLYQVFYYTGALTTANCAALYEKIETLKYGTDVSQPGWDGWSDTKPADLTTVKAIAIAIKQDKQAVLSSNESYIATYHMTVGKLDESELAERSWNNAVNSFACQYWQFTDDKGIDNAQPVASLLSSNLVSTTILPEPVKVGGHIWIDKDGDGKWEDGESVADLSSNALVQKLLSEVEISLYTYRGGDSIISHTDQFNKTSNQNWTADANFVFENLDPASKKDSATEAQLYSNTAKNNPLQPLYLKGTEAKTYRLGVTIPENSNLLYTVTSLGYGDETKQTGYSREPQDLQAGGQYEEETLDNNFTQLTSSRTSVSERFFLHASASDVFDNTKDIGLILNRNLVIEKISASDPTVKLQGAQFEIYGPFTDVAQANAATLDKDNLLTTVTTDQNGQAVAANLNWFNVYVIVEKQSAYSYQLEGAQAFNTDGVLEEYQGNATENPAWILNVPGDAITNTRQTVQVTNKTEVQYALVASKMLEGGDLKDQQFAFELLDENGTVLETAYNVGDTITFGPFDANKEGEITYFIREKIPDAAAGNVLNDIAYDTQQFKAVAKITRNTGNNNRLQVNITYYRQDDNGRWVESAQGAQFVNLYLPAHVTTYRPAVIKDFTADSAPRPADARFTFTLEAQADYDGAVLLPLKEGQSVCTVQVNGQGPAYFDPVQFSEEGVYRFIIREVNEGQMGYRYDTATWTLEVETQKKDGHLTVTRAEYSSDAGGSGSFARFVNYYEVGETPEEPLQEGGNGTFLDPFIAQTGDNSNPMLWLILMIGALAGACVAFWAGRRARKKRK